MSAKPSRLIAFALALTLAVPLTALASVHLRCINEHHACAPVRVLASCCCHSVVGDAAGIQSVLQEPQALSLFQVLEPAYGNDVRVVIPVTDVRLSTSPPDFARRDLPTLFSVLLL